MVTTLQRWTVADIAALPDEAGTRYEVINGELCVSRQPHWHHQFTCGRINVVLDTWSEQTGRGLTIPAPGIIYAEDEAVAPDVVWVSAERLDAVLSSDGKLYASPDLVVEVVSVGRANEERDREEKRALYDRRGVREYWIVDWAFREMDVYRREQGDLLRVATLRGEDVLTSPLLPGFSCPVRRLFEPKYRVGGSEGG